MSTRRPAPRLVVVGLVLASGVVGCGGPEAAGPAASPAAAARLAPADEQTPPGTRRVTCAVGSAHGPVTLALALPRGYRPVERPPADCAWTARVVARTDSPDPTDRVSWVYPVVTVTGVGPASSLRQERDDRERYVADRGEPAGDDAISDLVLEEGVSTLGTVRGDALSYRCACDGQDTTYRAVQADEVRLVWSSYAAQGARAVRQFDRAVASAGTVG